MNTSMEKVLRLVKSRAKKYVKLGKGTHMRCLEIASKEAGFKSFYHISQAAKVPETPADKSDMEGTP